MKQSKKLTRSMKELLSKNKLISNNWSLHKETATTYTFVNKRSKNMKVLTK